MTNERNLFWRPRLKHFARRLRLIETNTGYTHFIILGRSRTGSNFLRGLLNSHPQIVTFGELFRNYDTVDWAYPGYRQTEAMMQQMQSDPVDFLEQEVFGGFPTDIRAVGFKIFYYHAREHGWARLWDHLEATKPLHVIHIKRRNMLKTHISRKRAAQTEVWTDTTGSSHSVGPLTLDYAECLADFERTRAWEAEYDARFADHPFLEIMYEDLARNHVVEMRRVQNFLGVPYQDLKPDTFRQSGETLQQAIANYDELRAQFAGTPWEAFFES